MHCRHAPFSQQHHDLALLNLQALLQTSLLLRGANGLLLLMGHPVFLKDSTRLICDTWHCWSS